MLIKKIQMTPRRCALVIVVGYLVLFPITVFLGLGTLSNTMTVFKPPPGSLVGETEAMASVYLSKQVVNNPLFLVFHNVNSTTSITSNKHFEELYRAIENEAVSNDFWNRTITFITGYYSVPSTIPSLQAHFIGGPANSTALMTMEIGGGEWGDAAKKLLSPVNTFVSNWIEANNASLWYETTSVPQILNDIVTGLKHDIFTIDVVSMPLAVAALAICLNSFRVIVIPAVTLPVTFLLAFSFLYPVTCSMSVASLAPEMAGAVMMAISVDYTLFIMSRFYSIAEQQEALHGKSEETKWEVVKRTTILSSHNILISGLTIAAALGGLAMLPVEMIASIGIALCLGCLTAVLVSLTLMPALVLVFYDFFRQEMNLDCKRFFRKGSDALNDDDDGESQLLQEKVKGTESYEQKMRKKQFGSPWFKVGILAFRFPVLVAVGVLALGIPFFYFSSKLRVDFDLFNQVPRDSVHAGVLKEISTQIGNGQAAPFYLTFETNRTNGVMTDDFFKFVQQVTGEVCQATGQPKDRVLSFAEVNVPGVGEIPLTADLALSLLKSEIFNTTLAPMYQFLFSQLVGDSRRAAQVSLMTTFDPFQSIAKEYLDSVQKVIDRNNANHSNYVTMGIMGGSSSSWMIQQKVMQLFPWQVAVTLGVIFIFIAIVFRSVFIPFRMVITVAYTVAISLGFGVIFVQYDWCHTFWPQLEGVRAFPWFVPIFCFSLLCALALDYDVFLLTRLVEYRKMGFSNEATVAKAVWRTGRVISFAGIIMGIAFGSLVLSSISLMNIFGLVALFAVLVDTFIVRPFLVPALMSIFPDASWWPRKFPTNDRELGDMDETNVVLF